MTTKRQIVANSKNAQNSTGPKSKEGLQKVSQNALTHGLTSSKHIILPDESMEEYGAFVSALEADFQVSTQAEKILVEKMAQAQWKKMRLRRYEQTLLNAETEYNVWQLQQKKEEGLENQAIQALEFEITTLKKYIGHLEASIEECQRINRIRKPDRFQEEAEWFYKEAYQDVENAYESLKGYLDTMILLSKSDSPQNRDELFYIVIRRLTSMVRIWSENNDPSKRPICTYVLEQYHEVLQERLEQKELEKERILESRMAKLRMMFAGCSLWLSEEQQARVQRYEAALDNQYYKALQELQKLQVFLIQKQKAMES